MQTFQLILLGITLGVGGVIALLAYALPRPPDGHDFTDEIDNAPNQDEWLWRDRTLH